jgi:hypothetical protein
MIKTVSKEQLRSVRKRLTYLYGSQSEQLLERFAMMIGRYGVGLDPVQPDHAWNEHDSILITYADSLQDPSHQHSPLETLGPICGQTFGWRYSDHSSLTFLSLDL